MKDLRQIQRELEETAQQQGQQKFLKNLQTMRDKGSASEGASEASLLKQVLLPVAQQIEAWVKMSDKPKASKYHSALQFLKGVDPEVVAYVGLKEFLNSCHNPPLEMVLCRRIGAGLNVEVNLERLRKVAPAHSKAIIKTSHEKTATHRKLATAAYMMRKTETVQEWGKRNHVVVGAVVLACMIEAGVAISHSVNEVKGGKFMTRKTVLPSDEVMAYLKEADEKLASIAAVHEPMVVPPRDWKTPYTGAYLTRMARQVRLVKTHSKELLRDLRAANDQLAPVYDALNKTQRTPYRINKTMLEFLQEVVETNTCFGKLPPVDPAPEPVKPVDMENPKVKMAYAKSKERWHVEELQRRGRMFSVQLNLKTAKKFSEFSEIYIPVSIDWRGRVYCVPSLNYQGEDYMRSLFEFAEGKPLGSEGADWLAMHLANLWGNDKVDLDSRRMWTHLHTQEILSYVEDPWENRGWTEADKPFCFLAACIEWAGYIREGESYVSHLGVALDGSCSGLQNYGMALRCKETGEAVNLVPSDRPQDIYQRVSDKVKARVQGDLGMPSETPREVVLEKAMDAVLTVYNEVEREESWEDFKERVLGVFRQDGEVVPKEADHKRAKKAYDKLVLSWGWLNLGINRKTAKRSVMTYPYGAKKFGFAEQLMDDILTPSRNSHAASNGISKSPSGFIAPESFHTWYFSDDGFDAAKYLAEYLWDAIQETVVKASEAMSWLQSVAQVWLKETEKPVEWVAPNGMLCRQRYLKTKPRTIKTNFYGKTIRYRLQEEIDELDRKKGANGIAPNFIHSMDASHLMHTVTHSGLSSFMLIHDSFATHAADTGTLFRQVRKSFQQMYEEHDIFQNFYDRAVEEIEKAGGDSSLVPQPPSKGSLDLALVNQSDFAFA